MKRVKEAVQNGDFELAENILKGIIEKEDNQAAVDYLKQIQKLKSHLQNN